MTAGLTCGDLVFPLIYSPELHFSEYNSVVADMKNAVKVSLTNLFVTVPNFWATPNKMITKYFFKHILILAIITGFC